jgi:hypothetical protein
VNVVFLSAAFLWSIGAAGIVTNQLEMRITSLSLIKLANSLLLMSLLVYAAIFLGFRMWWTSYQIVTIAASLLLLLQVAAACWFGNRNVSSDNPAHKFKNVLGGAIIGLCCLVFLLSVLLAATPGISLHF